MHKFSHIFTLLFWVTFSSIAFAQTSINNRSDFELFINQHPYSLTPRQTPKQLKQVPKYDRPDLAWEQDYLRTLDPNTGKPEYDRLTSIFQQTSQQQALTPAVPGSPSFPWVERGPDNVAGRTRALLWDPNAASGNKVWAGGVTGGLWYNNDITSATSQWQAVNDFWDNIAVTCIAFDPNNTQIMYVGTGESFTGASRGAGIWKSTDGGNSWNLLNSTSNFFYINDIIVRNENGSSVVYAAVDGRFYMGSFHGSAQAGLQRSTDGGLNWTQVLPNLPSSTSINLVAADIELGSDNRIWIGTDPSPFSATDRGGGRILYSDLGTLNSWTTAYVQSVNNGRGRVELACAPSNANVVYALIEDNRQVDTILKTTNKGVSWIGLPQPDDDDNGIQPNDFSRGQAWYDLIAAVDPNNENSVIIGAINLHRSTNGGTSWNQISKWSNNANMGTQPYSYVHADQHAINFKPGNSNVVIFGTDGGVSYTANVANAATSNVIFNRNNGYNVTQYYACAIHPSAGSNNFLAGSQDNGTQEYNSAGINSTIEKFGGDGAFCFIDQNEPNIKIVSYVYNNYYLFNNNTYQGQILNDDNSGAFINIADYDDNLNILYTYNSQSILNKVTNITSSSTGNSGTISHNFLAPISALKVSPHTTSSSKLFVGTSSGRLFRVENANTNTPTVTEITSGSFPTGSISSIEFGTSENEMLVTFSNYGVNSVWYSSNGGTSFSNKEGNLPDMPIRWGLMNPNNLNEAILATEVGIWSTTNFLSASPAWSASNSGLANVRVDMLQMRNSDFEVIAATHGRGLFSSSAFNANTSLNLTANIQNANCGGATGSITINPGLGTSPFNYSWSNNANTQTISNLSPGIYSVTVTDATNLTDSLTIQITGGSAIPSFPYAESFENSFGFWYNDTLNDDIDWVFDFNGTPSALTGPSGPSQGSFYTRIEASAPGSAANDIAYLVSQCIDLNGAVSPTIQFDYHMWSEQLPASNPIFRLQADSGDGNWFSIFTRLGNQGNQWNTETVSLQQFVGKTINLRFMAQIGTGGNFWCADMAIDAVTIFKNPPLAVNATIIQPGCNINSGSISLQVSGGSGNYNYNWSNGDTAANLTNLTGGIYTVTVTDGTLASISESFQILNNSTVNAFPYVESFENSLGFWEQDSIADEIDWEFDFDGTPTGFTGPSGPSNGSFYLRIEASQPPLGNGSPGARANLISPCFNLTNGVQPNISFDYHLFSDSNNVANASNPSLTLSVDTGNGQWIIVFQEFADKGNQWVSENISLLQFNGKNIRLKFTAQIGTTGNFVTSDVGLDNIKVSLFPPLSISSLVNQPQCGNSTQGSINVIPTGGSGNFSYLWNTGNTNSQITNLSAGIYSVSVFDNAVLVDSISYQIFSNPQITQFPYRESFENTFGLFQQDELTDELNWEFDFDGTPTAQTGPPGPSDGNFYIRIESSAPPLGQGSPGAKAHLISPCVDFTGAVTPSIFYDLHQFSGFSNPSFYIAADTGNGIWFDIDSVKGSQGNQWVTRTTPLNNFVGKSARFRFTAKAGTNANYVTSDIGLDNVYIAKFPPLVLDSAVVSNAPQCTQQTSSVQLFVSGGDPPYNYTWDNGSTSDIRTGLLSGKYFITVTDGYNQIITDSVEVQGGSVSIFPYSYDWENGLDIWEQETLIDDFNWTIQQGPTTSTSTGPFGANTGSFYIYTEASGRTNGDSAIIYSPCFDLNGSPAPFISFENHMRGNSAFTLQLLADSGNGNWQILYSHTGNKGINWFNDTVNLFHYKNKVTRFMFLGVLNAGSGAIFNGDMALDLIRVEEGLPLKFNNITSTNAACLGINSGSISAAVEGGYAPYSFTYSLNGNNFTNGSLPSGSITVTATDIFGQSIDTVINLGTDINITINTNVTDESCPNAQNGSITASASGSPFFPYSYSWSNAVNGGANQNLTAGVYTVTATDLIGCQGIKTDTVQVGTPFNLSLNPANIDCFGNANGSIATQVTGATGALSYQWSNNTSGSNISGLSAGKYYVTVTEAGTCSVTDSAVIIEPAQLNITLNPTPVLCKGALTGSITGTLGGGTSPFSIIWSNGITGSVNQNNIGAGKYIIQISDSNNCQLTDSVEIIEPSLGLTVQDSVVNETCFGSADGGAAVQPFGGTPPYNYLWPSPIPSGNQFALGLSAGNYTVTITDSVGCSITNTLTVNSPPQISVLFDSVPDVCALNNPITLNAVPSGGIFAGPGVIGNIFNPINLNAGIINLKYFYTDAFGCSDSASQNVQVDTSVNVSIQSIAPLCQTANSFNLTSGNPIGGVYRINGNTISNLNPGTFNPGIYPLKYFVSGGCGLDSAATSLEILNTPFANAGQNQNIAIGNSTTLTGSKTAFNLNSVSSVWSPGSLVLNPNSDTTNTVVLNNTSTFSFTATDTLTGCSTTDSVLINVISSPLLVSANANQDTICEGTSVNLNVNVSGGTGNYSYQWSPQNVISNTSLQNPFATLNTSSWLVVSVTDGNSTVTDSVFVTVVSNPSVSLSVPQNYCATDSGIVLSGGIPSGGIYHVNGVMTSIFNPIFFGVSQPTISYEFSNSFGCVSSTNQQVNILPSPNPTLLPFADVCSNSNAFSLSGGSPSGGVFSGIGITGGNFNPNVTGAGTFDIKYIVSVGSCSDSAIQNITVNAAPTIDAGNDTSIVSGNSFQFNTTFSGTNLLFNWQPQNLLNNHTLSAPTTTSLNNSTLFQVSVTDTVTGCQASDNILVSVTGGPLAVTVNASNLNICQGDSVNLTALASGGSGVYSYQWNNASKLSNANIFNPIATTDSAIQFNVTVSDGINSVSGNVVINVFSPSLVQFNQSASLCISDPSITLSATPSGGVFTGPGVTSNTFSPSGAGLGKHTVIYTFTNVNGCVTSDSSIFKVNNIPLLSSTGSLEICDNDQAQLLQIFTPQGGSYSGAAIINNIFNPGIGAGKYLVNYQYTDTNLCSANALDSITVLSSPTVNAGVNQTVPTGMNTQFFASASSSSGIFTSMWSPTTFLLNPNSLTSNVVGINQSTLYTLTVTDTINGCSNSDQMSITVTGGPLNINLSVDKDTICAGETIQLFALAGGGTGNYSYTWNNSALSNDTIANPTGNPISTTTYVVSVFDSINTITDSITVTVLLSPQVFINMQTSFCENDAPILLNNGLPLGGNYSGSGVAGNFFNPAAAGVGLSKIFYSLTDPNGCSGIDSALININPAPNNVTLNLSNKTTCENGNNILLTGGLPIGGNYQWLNNSSSTFNPSGVAAGNYAVTYTFVNTFGCSAFATDTVSVGASPTIALLNLTDASCNGGNDGSININTSGGTGTLNIVWSNGILNNNVVSGLSAGNYNVVVFDSVGCSSSSGFTVNEPNPLNLQLTAQNILCFGANNGSIIASTTGGVMPYSYNWSNGLSNDTINNLSPNTFIVTVTDGNGCTQINSGQINQPSALQLNLTSSPVSCNNLADGSADATVSGGTSPYTYLWESGAQTANNNKISGGFQAVTITDFNGCTIVDSIFIFEPQPVNVGIFAVGNTSFCTGGSVFLNANPTTYPNYQWRLNGVNISGATQPVYSASVAGNYSVQATDTNGCKGTSTFTAVTVFPNPTIVFNGVLDNYCENADSAILSALPAGGIFKGNSVINNVLLPNQLNLGTYQIQYTVTDTNGCTDSAWKRIDIREAPEINNLLGPTMVQPGNTYTYAINATNGSQYFWSASNGIISSVTNNLATILWPSAGTGEIQVIESNYFGCLDTGKFFISIGVQISTNDAYSENEITLFPNPAKDEISIEYNQLNTEQINIKLFSVTGQLILEKTSEFTASKNIEKIDVSNLTTGIYIVTLTNGNINKNIQLIIN